MPGQIPAECGTRTAAGRAHPGAEPPGVGRDGPVFQDRLTIMKVVVNYIMELSLY